MENNEINLLVSECEIEVAYNNWIYITHSTNIWMSFKVSHWTSLTHMFSECCPYVYI